MINPKKDISFCLIRRPLLNLNVLKEWFEAEVPENYVRDKFKQPQLLEALYLASRSLHQRATLQGAQDDKSLPPGPERSALTLALAKYLTRAAFRCTPYGLFASIQKAAIGDATSPRPVALRRSVHLDGGVETRLVERLLAIPAVRRSAQWVFNSTYVILGHSDRATYVGIQKTEKHQRKFVSSEAEHDWVLDQIKGFCQTPKPYLEIESLLSELNTGSEEERHEYIEQVIEAGILIPALPNVVSSVSALQRLVSWIAPAGDFEAIRESL